MKNSEKNLLEIFIPTGIKKPVEVNDSRIQILKMPFEIHFENGVC